MSANEKKNLTIRLDARVIEKAKAYAAAHNTSISQLVEVYFLELNRMQRRDSPTPILDELTGILVEEVRE